MHTVLIVDDEKIERKGIRSLVEREDSDCRIMEAENGREAAELLEEENVDILLTDIRMPHMNGMELAERAAGCSGSTQTIIFSGLQDFEYARTAIEYGVKLSGLTVHFVDERYDNGAIILQRAVEVLPGDTPETLQGRILEQEHIALPLAVRWLTTGKIVKEGRKVSILP